MIIRLKSYVAGILQWFRVKQLCARKKIHSNSNEISVCAAYGKNIRIGKNVIITDDVSIGDHTYVNRNSSLENCVIGKYCSISEGVKINPIEHNLSLITTHPVAGENGHYGRKNETVHIGNDVLISLNAIILSGVHIGDGAVIGAGAVVTKDVPAYAVVAGVPAKVLRYRFAQEEIKTLERLKWWDWPEDKIQRNLPFLRKEATYIVD